MSPTVGFHGDFISESFHCSGVCNIQLQYLDSSARADHKRNLAAFLEINIIIRGFRSSSPFQGSEARKSAAKADMVFYPDIPEIDCYEDWELELSLGHAQQNARLNSHNLSKPHSTTRTDSLCGNVLDSNSEAGTRDLQDDNAKHGFWTALNHDSMLERYNSFNQSYDERSDWYCKRPLSKAELFLLQSGQHSKTMDDDTDDSFASCKLLTREELRQIRKKKAAKMRTSRVVCPKVEARFRCLRLDAPCPQYALQAQEEWEESQANVKHAQLKLENEMRIQENALNFRYSLRMSSKPAPPNLIKCSKSCFATGLRTQSSIANSVRFDDVHTAKVLRWVDVEHLAELACSQVQEYTNAF